MPSRFSQSSFLWIAILLVLVGGLCACHPTKRLAEGEVFLRKQEIEISGNYDKTLFEKEDLEVIRKQKTNRKILLMRFHLWMFNRVNPLRQEEAKARKSLRMEYQLGRWEAKYSRCVSDPPPSSRKCDKWEEKIKRLKKAKVRTWRDWITETVGEAPVVLDSLKCSKSAEQMSIFLSKNGYFNNEVDYSVGFSRNGKKANVTYSVNPGPIYTLRNIDYHVDDAGIKRRLGFLKETSLLDSGQAFSVSRFDQERERITHYLNNRGYFGFTKDYIVYKADSAVGSRQVDLTMEFLNPSFQDSDSTLIQGGNQHLRYFIGDIYIDTEFDVKDLDNLSRDTLYYEGLRILYKGELGIKPSLIAYTVYFDKGDLYQKDKAQKTFRRFNNLQLFRSVTVQFEPRADSKVHVLDCYIRLIPAKDQFISLQTRGTNRDGNLGVQANVNYTHRNLFDGAEQGNVTIKTGFEAQQVLTQTDQELDLSSGDVASGLRFNTFEIGPEFSLSFHNIFQLDLDRFSRNSTPTSKLSMAFNYQSRPDYTRTLTEFRYEGRWVENLFRGRTYFFHLPEISLIKIEKSDSFQRLLNDIGDDFLTNSYQDHFVFSALGVGAVFNNQKLKRQRRYHYFNFNIDGAGTLLRGFMNWFGGTTDDAGNYHVAGIQFAQYTRLEADYREYWNLDEKNALVVRFDGGVGLAWKNLSVLPFEKSFFSGGANSLRAWQARTLGPGSFRDTTASVAYNNIGEIKLEGNLEYRFKLTPTFEGALFLDVGNIWMMEESESRPGSGIGADFISELAVGTGVGFRFDLDFFLIRFDLGLQLKDPAKIPGERWLWEPKDDYNEFVKRFYPPGESPGYFPVVNFNLGIGYPF